MYRKILASIMKLYRKAGLVHGDLSEYNIMVWKGEPVIFDLSQSVPLEHPMAEIFVKRDIININTYFAAHGVNVKPASDIYDQMVSRVA